MKVAIMFTLALIAFAQDNYVFGPSIMVNDDPAGTHWHCNRPRSIACRGDTVYEVWDDARYGTSQVFFSRSTDAGKEWSPNLLISQYSDSIGASHGHIAQDGTGNIYVVFHTYNINTANEDIYFTKSIDGGITFSLPVVVNDSVQVLPQRDGSVAVDSGGSNVYVVWQDGRNTQYGVDIYGAHSTDGGAHFEPSVRINDDSTSRHQWLPRIVCNNTGQNVYVVWQDQRDTIHNWDIYFCRSIDYGQSFGTNYPINDTISTGNSAQGNPSIAYKNSVVYAVWRDQRDDSDVFFAKSTDDGASFGQNVRVTDSLSESGANPSVAVDDSGRIYAVWRDTRYFSTYGHDIYFAFSRDSGQTFNANVCVNDHLGIIGAWDWNPSVCANQNSRVFVAWDSERTTFMRPDIYCASGDYVGIVEQYADKPTSKLSCYPNPFGQALDIRLSALVDDKAELKIYDAAGRLVQRFIQPTRHIFWHGDDDAGCSLPRGIYFVVFTVESEKNVEKVVKIR